MMSEAISAMRAYQKDVRTHGELEREIGSDISLGKTGPDVRRKINELTRLEADIAANPVGAMIEEGLFTSIAEDLGADDDTMRGALITKVVDKTKGIIPEFVVEGVKELYMLPGSRGYKAAVSATQYGDFVARYVKYNYDIDVKGVDKATALKETLDSFIYYDIPQNRQLQYLNDTGFFMFTKFFFRIQHVIARLYSQNPASAFAVLGLQSAMLPSPFDENIMNYGFGDGLLNKPTINPVGKAWEVLHEPGLVPWLWPF
jgi:hypothetical protein